MSWDDAVVDLEADHATQIAVAAEQARDMVALGYAVDFDGPDRVQFYALLREILPSGEVG